MNDFLEFSKLCMRSTEILVQIMTKANAGAYSIFEHNVDTMTKTGKQIYNHTQDLMSVQSDIVSHLCEDFSV